MQRTARLQLSPGCSERAGSESGPRIQALVMAGDTSGSESDGVLRHEFGRPSVARTLEMKSGISVVRSHLPITL